MNFISRKATFLISALILVSGLKSIAQDFKEPTGRLVSDFANILSSDELSRLESKLVAFNDSTSTQIAVVLIHSTGGYEIADYSVQLFNKWHIGQSSKNNGILVLAAIDDHKVWITSGYGAEGVLPDALIKGIVDHDIVPAFRRGDYYEGLDEATTSIMSVVSGEFTANEYLKKKKDKPVIFPFLMFFFIFFIIIVSRFGRARRYARKNNLGFWAAWALMNAASRSSRGSWGGFSGGSGWGGGGGGGFGGFGGGSSGGGGAGGSW